MSVQKSWSELQTMARAARIVIDTLDALEQAIYDRPGTDGLIHHSDRGVQYLSIRYTERLEEAGIERSVGSRGDSYDNALAESVIGLYKTEVIRRRGPWRRATPPAARVSPPRATECARAAREVAVRSLRPSSRNRRAAVSGVAGSRRDARRWSGS